MQKYRDHLVLPGIGRPRRKNFQVWKPRSNSINVPRVLQLI
jgi:hypothetical protein